MLETLKKSWSKVRHKWKVFKIEAEYRFFFKVNRVFYWGAKRYDAPYLLFVAEYIAETNKSNREMAYRIIELEIELEEGKERLYNYFKAKKL